MASMTPWTMDIPNGFDDDWKNKESSENRDPNWLRYFCEYDKEDEEKSTNHFKNYFYSERQIVYQKDKDASFNDIRKLTLKLLAIAPNLAASSPGYGPDLTPPALLLGKSSRNFQRPKFALIYNPPGAQNNNFYACFQCHEEINRQIPKDQTIIFDGVDGWIRFNEPIQLDQDGELEFNNADLLEILQRFLFEIDAYAIGNHEYYTECDRPDKLPRTSPIYPKLIDVNRRVGDRPAGDITNQDHTKSINIMNQNTILFGPPGTGKTYNTLLTALHALNFKNENNEHLNTSYKCLINDQLYKLEDSVRENFKRKFENHINTGRIIFTTFHQSYAYEEFIEGIRVRNIDKQVYYEIYNGTFKQLSRKALFYKAAQLSDESIDNSFESTADFYASTLDVDLKDWLNKYDQNQEIYSKHAKYKDLIDKIINNDAEIQKVIHHKSNDETPKFILIIDEVNRGNISKIFGELITLIEDSKRAGGSDRATVKLPSSRETFCVPDNLYIIGTMNTADRSLATLDVALRRRFDFIEMMPQPDFLDEIKIAQIDLKQWFIKLNKNIQIARGREFTIGHAFFASLKEIENPNIEDLATIMQRKILPLLDEYFFDDWEGISRILGDDNSNNSARFIKINENGSDKYYTWNRDALTKTEAYTKLYEKNNVTGTQIDAEQ